MKFKTTKKAMYNYADHVIMVGYCELDWLLDYKNPLSYCLRAEGWACDNYLIDNVIISTGYNPIKSKNLKVSDTELDKIAKAYEQKAWELRDKYRNYEDIKKETNKLLNKFIKEVTK